MNTHLHGSGLKKIFIVMDLPKPSTVRLHLYNILGSEISTIDRGTQQPGLHSITIDMRGYSSGVHYYRIEAGEFFDTNKLVFIK